jgi:hypothetical protein
LVVVAAGLTGRRENIGLCVSSATLSIGEHGYKLRVETAADKGEEKGKSG